MDQQTMLYDGDTFERDGRRFTFKTEWDDSMRAPWEEHDGHGAVTAWTTRDKKPGERVLHSAWRSRRYYDFAETMRVAKRDGWGLGDDDKAALAKRLGRTPTHGDIAAEAVERDFNRMRDWCLDRWNWIGVIVTHEDSGEFDSLWGIESDDYDGMREIANELADQINERLDSAFVARCEAERPDLHA